MKKVEQSIMPTIILALYGPNIALTMKEEIVPAAEIYEQHLVPAMFEPFARDLIRLCNIRRSDRILDVACGTGIVSRLAIDYVDVTVGKVVGVDINPVMLNVAHHCSAGKDIDWKQGSATSLPFPNESFDLVMCQQGLQFFPDRRKALTEMNRVLVRATSNIDKDYGYGTLVLSVWTSIKDSPGFSILERLLQETIGHEGSNNNAAASLTFRQYQS